MIETRSKVLFTGTGTGVRYLSLSLFPSMFHRGGEGRSSNGLLPPDKQEDKKQEQRWQIAVELFN